jgi:carbamoyl-phosphate synthase large subunit
MERQWGGLGGRSVAVMVTSAGSAPAVAVIQALREQQEIPVRVVAADMDRLSVGFSLADERVVIPAAGTPEFVERVLEACRQFGVTVVFPIIDEELQLFADAAPQFAAHRIHVVTNPPEVVRVAKDKWLTHEWCLENAVQAPHAWLPNRLPVALRYPVIVKPRGGRGSAGVELARDAAELGYHLACGANLMIQEYIDGPEFTVDILADATGRVVSVVPRERLMTKAGMCVKGRTLNASSLLDLSVHVAEAFGLTPRGNVQFKQSRQDSRYYLIEVNPKFGAGLPLTTAAGVNMPLLILKMLAGERIAPMVGQFQNELVMLRHWTEVFLPGESPTPTERLQEAVSPHGRAVELSLV